MKINDQVAINDFMGIKGVVVLKKMDGTIIFRKENMIVQTGRDYLRDVIILNSISTTISSALGFSSIYKTDDPVDYRITHIGFGSSGTATQLTTSELILPNEDLIITLTQNEIDLFSETKAIVFKGTIDNKTSSPGYSVKELGLYITDTIDDDPISTKLLFSRVVFDPIPVASGDEYEIEYYIYF